MKIISLLLFIYLFCFSSEGFLYKDEHQQFEVDGISEKNFEVRDILGDKIKVVIESLGNDYNIEVQECVDNDDEECEYEKEGKKTIITYYTERNNKYFYFTIKVNEKTNFDIYYYKPVMVSTVLKIIFFVLLGLVIIYGIYRFKKYADREMEKDNELKQQHLVERKEKQEKIDEQKELISKFFHKISENPYYLNFVCPICFKTRNDEEILGDEALYVNTDGLEEDSSENFKNNFIEGINNKSITKVIDYFKPKICKHFYHEECKNQIKKFKCYLCENYITPYNIKVICDLTENEFKNALYKTHNINNNIVWRENSYLNNFIKSIYSFIRNNNEISEERKKVIKEKRDLALKFIKPEFEGVDFEIDLEENNQDWEEKLEERKEKRKQHREKEIELQEQRQQQREEEAITCFVCSSNCKGKCAICKKDYKFGSSSKVHRRCYKTPYCIICHSKNATYVPSSGFCIDCKDKYKVREEKNCLICRGPL